MCLVWAGIRCVFLCAAELWACDEVWDLMADWVCCGKVRLGVPEGGTAY